MNSQQPFTTARTGNAVDFAAFLAGNSAEVEAWIAYLSDTPMSWLERQS